MKTKNKIALLALAVSTLLTGCGGSDTKLSTDILTNSNGDFENATGYFLTYKQFGEIRNEIKGNSKVIEITGVKKALDSLDNLAPYALMNYESVPTNIEQAKKDIKTLDDFGVDSDFIDQLNAIIDDWNKYYKDMSQAESNGTSLPEYQSDAINNFRRKFVDLLPKVKGSIHSMIKDKYGNVITDIFDDHSTELDIDDDGSFTMPSVPSDSDDAFENRGFVVIDLTKVKDHRKGCSTFTIIQNAKTEVPKEFGVSTNNVHCTKDSLTDISGYLNSNF